MDIDSYMNPSSAHSVRCLKHQLKRERESKPWFFSIASRSPCDSETLIRNLGVSLLGGLGCPLTTFTEVHLDYLKCFHRPGCWAFALNACIGQDFICECVGCFSYSMCRLATYE